MVMSTRRVCTPANMPAKSATSGSTLRSSFLATACRMSPSSPTIVSPCRSVYGAYGWMATFRTPGVMVSRLAAFSDTDAGASPPHPATVNSAAQTAAVKPALRDRLRRLLDMVGLPWFGGQRAETVTTIGTPYSRVIGQYLQRICRLRIVGCTFNTANRLRAACIQLPIRARCRCCGSPSSLRRSELVGKAGDVEGEHRPMVAPRRSPITMNPGRSLFSLPKP